MFRRCCGRWSAVDLPLVEELLAKGYRVQLPIRVWWGDMDAMAHVNNAMYIKYVEHARVEYMATIGVSLAPPTSAAGMAHSERQAALDVPEPSLIVASLSCRFRRPLTYPDVVTVGSKLAALDAERGDFDLEHVIWSREQRAIVATAVSGLVAYDYVAGKRMAFPDIWKDRIRSAEGVASLPGPKAKAK
jgi:acyl-CoA thioester hydrolase